MVAVLFAVGRSSGQTDRVKYEPNWESLDKRPLPDWYDEGKFGIFIHWGVFSVPSFVSEWFWRYWVSGRESVVNFMKKNYPPDFTYADFAAKFTAEFYNPHQWADIFKASRAKYIVLTSKHHEGFTNWPSSVSFNWNSMDVGPKRDLVGDLAAAIRNRTDIHFGVYHSLYEWFNPLYNEDSKSGFKTNLFVERKTMPELYELVNRYKPDIIWSDGDAGPDTYWNSTGFLAWLYNESPVKDTVVTNDRWGSGIACHHGGFYTCSDRYNPGKLQNHKWENCMTIDQSSWGFRREATLSSYLTIESLITTLAETVSCGGNLLMNVGPTHDGRIVPIFEERLKQIGSWLDVNGAAIFATKPWKHQNDTVTKDVWYTSKVAASGATEVYAIVLKWPKNNILYLGAPVTTSDTRVTMLGYKGKEFSWKGGEGINITFPAISYNELPCQWSWVLKMENLLTSLSTSSTALNFENRFQLQSLKRKKEIHLYGSDDVIQGDKPTMYQSLKRKHDIHLYGSDED